jgi:hypothetical protein
LAKQQIQVVNEMASALENDAPQAKLDELQDRNNKLNKQLEALKLSTEDKRRLTERHKAELVPAIERLQKAMLAKAMKGGEGIPGFSKEGFPGFPKEGFPGFPKEGFPGFPDVKSSK